jgi:tRNA A-37 threonylcarbamoyl transferase component Bud32
MKGCKGVIKSKVCQEISDDHVYTVEEFEEIIRKVQTLHTNGIVHRDLRLHNLIHDTDHEILFIDYGLSFVYPDEVPQEMRYRDYATLYEHIKEYYQEMLPSYLKALKKYLSKGDIDKIVKLGKKIVLTDEISSRHFPEEMMNTISYNQATQYFNWADNDEKIADQCDDNLADAYGID